MARVSRLFGLGLVGLGFVSLVGPAAAAPEIGLTEPRAGDKVEVGGSRQIQILLGMNPDTTKFECTLKQGKNVWRSKEQASPRCSIPPEELTKFGPGPAEVSGRVFYKKAWVPTAKATIELVAPQAGSGPKARGGGGGGTLGADGLPPLDGIKVGTSAPASWDSTYEGNGSSKGYLWCPSMWELKKFEVAGGEAKFQVWLGAVGAQGQPKKAPVSDPAAHVVVSAKIGADGKVSGGVTFTPETTAWLAAHPDALPPGTKSLTFSGKVENVNKHEGGSYLQGRTFGGSVSIPGGAGGCDFKAEAADFRHSFDNSWVIPSGGGGSRGGGSNGGGAEACKKACMHTEATCTGARGDCMAQRQRCVKSCG